MSHTAHNFNDAKALLIAFTAQRISKKDANARYTSGYRRVEMIGWVIAATALLALIIDFGTAALLWSMSRGSRNVRAFIHNIVGASGLQPRLSWLPLKSNAQHHSSEHRLLTGD